ncbi:MAG: NF038129 family PEP-CTERM protein [Pseudomonadota bacterium]
MFAPLSRLYTLLPRAALALALAAGLTGAAHAGTIHFAIDTAGFGASGYLDMQFAGANLDVLPASATVSNLTGFDPAATVELNGDVAPLAGGYRFGNAPGWNDLFYAVNFGGVFGFDVTFDGSFDPALFINASRFGVGAYAADGVTALGLADPASGFLAAVDWTPSATPGGSAGAVISVFDAGAVTAVPEPAGWLLGGTALALVVLSTRRRAVPRRAA